MVQKIKQWWAERQLKKLTEVPEMYTRQQLEKAHQLGYNVGYNDGRRDGLAVAREQATKSLKEILWQQNKTTNQKTPEHPKS